MSVTSRADLGFALYKAVWIAALFVGLFLQPQGAFSDLSVVAGFCLITIISIFQIVDQYRGLLNSPFGIYGDLAYWLTILIGMFSVVYWNYGSATNFNIPLTRLDAVYFTIGTLTTAGTGNLVATSELARGLQSVQMLLDLGFISIAVTLVVTHLSALKAERDLSRPNVGYNYINYRPNGDSDALN